MKHDARLVASRDVIGRFARGENVDAKEVEGVLGGLDALEAEIAVDKLRMADVSEVLFGVASGDFAKRATMRHDGSDFDGLAGVVNMLSEEIAAQFEEHHRAAEALRQSDERLRAAQRLEAVGRLAGGIAHDFNNILSVIVSRAALGLESLSANHPTRNDLVEVRRAAERAAELTGQLLALSSQQVLDPKIVDLKDTLLGMQTMLRPVAGEHVEIALQTEPLCGVRIDPGQFERIVLNLAMNARDAMPHGGRLTIGCSMLTADSDLAGLRGEIRLPAGRYVKLEIADTGTGMDAATLEHVFEPFFTTKGFGKAAGLGLATVLGIVRQSGGGIRVTSAPGNGTTFEILFPYVPFVERAPSAAKPKQTTGAETILLVEDDPQVRNATGRVLRRQGYEVIAVSGPAEARAVCQNEAARIDLVLTDVVMPGGNGGALAAELEAAHPHLKVIVMSGYAPEGPVRDAVASGLLAFLHKPATPEALTRKIREVLESHPNRTYARSGSIAVRR